MREGSLEAPTRHPLAWQDPDFYDEAKLDAELRRVFDICHGCRRCFNLCDSFPRLFDLIDASKSGELDTVESKDFAPVVDACTLCDMCYMTKCPYVPPHAFNVDFPHLMLRYRAVEAKQGALPRADRELAQTDRNGKLASLAAPIANWATDRANTRTRKLLDKFAGLHPEAELPDYTTRSFTARAKAGPPSVNEDAPAYGRKAVLYATCYVNYNDPDLGVATQAVLARNGVQTEVVYPACCGMPLLEQGRIDKVADNARIVAGELRGWIDKGYDVIALVPSCALMLKSEWPLILPDDADVKRLSAATYDISEYVVDIARKEGLAPGLQPVGGGMAVHMACHARAQNMGQKAAEMLRLLPEADVQVIERCSGHGGAWGFKTANFPTALKVGRPVARQARDSGKSFVTSECPLAGVHIMQGIDKLGGDAAKPERVTHPIQLLARAYGIGA
ncbi:heterodisulfide reductase-related iron-sulfur binding cluster [Limobrevibacterium gyesilva]|uniref:Heterodisulfide reductase-related iron-sulfur binding cluster n=1 Tax=Limobrevibacterium gyesilva TaxID=2991712 RepID=A0AA42CG28_9PROT|nr:heterodisulfide reductase-related iron-sulfur binding cluster [Limobrevibacterium gyesilva]MCW3475576.1 heterodisulfide reductase-related iron-sulfur binding cluster [Limobrevibacterium gyesilva]